MHALILEHLRGKLSGQMQGINKDQLEPIPAVRLLDPRSAQEARMNPIMDSANIPFEELPARTGELPPKHETIRVAGVDSPAAQTVEWLRGHGRNAVQIVNFHSGPTPPNGRLWHPNQWLWTHLMPLRLQDVRPRTALDLGCGNGRDSVYLAAHNFRVKAVDHLPDCLDRGRDLANRYLFASNQEFVDWQLADVLDGKFELDKRFDLITLFYLFDRRLVGRCKDWLTPGGVLLVEAFTEVRQAKVGKPSSADRVVKLGEMKDLLGGLEILHLIEADQRHGNTARVWARKPISSG